MAAASAVEVATTINDGAKPAEKEKLTEFQRALRDEDVDAIIACIEGDPDLITEETKDGSSIAQYAAENNYPEILQIIASFSDDAVHECGTKNRRWPLLIAAAKGNMAAFKFVFKNTDNTADIIVMDSLADKADTTFLTCPRRVLSYLVRQGASARTLFTSYMRRVDKLTAKDQPMFKRIAQNIACVIGMGARVDDFLRKGRPTDKQSNFIDTAYAIYRKNANVLGIEAKLKWPAFLPQGVLGTSSE